jgi:hypothetical protein
MSVELLTPAFVFMDLQHFCWNHVRSYWIISLLTSVAVFDSGIGKGVPPGGEGAQPLRFGLYDTEDSLHIYFL